MKTNNLEDKGRISHQTAQVCDNLGCRMRTRIGKDGGPGCFVKLLRANGRSLNIIKEDYPKRIPTDCPEGYGT